MWARERKLGEGRVGMEDCATGLNDALSQGLQGTFSISCLFVSLHVGFIIFYYTPVSSTWWEIQPLVLLDSHSATLAPTEKRLFSLSRKSLGRTLVVPACAMHLLRRPGVWVLGYLDW